MAFFYWNWENIRQRLFQLLLLCHKPPRNKSVVSNILCIMLTDNEWGIWAGYHWSSRDGCLYVKMSGDPDGKVETWGSLAAWGLRSSSGQCFTHMQSPWPGMTKCGSHPGMPRRGDFPHGSASHSMTVRTCRATVPGKLSGSCMTTSRLSLRVRGPPLLHSLVSSKSAHMQGEGT